MARETISLVKRQIKRAAGGAYGYWVLRWRGPNGKWLSKNLGRTDQFSKRQAEKLRRQKEAEFETIRDDAVLLPLLPWVSFWRFTLRHENARSQAGHWSSMRRQLCTCRVVLVRGDD